MPESPWLTTTEAAAYVKLSPQSVRLACQSGVLKYVQPGGARGKILTRTEWLDAWLSSHQHG